MESHLLVVLLACGTLLIRVGLDWYISGLVRSKNAAGAILRSVLDMAVAALAFWAIGAAILDGSGSVFGIRAGLLFDARDDLGRGGAQGVAQAEEGVDGRRLQVAFELADIGAVQVGAEGQLRLTPEGIAFQRKGQATREWSVSWTDLVSASRDDGLWESPFTILLVERTGRKRYLSLIDGHGRYVAGDPLLNAIAAGKKAFRQGEKP